MSKVSPKDEFISNIAEVMTEATGANVTKVSVRQFLSSMEAVVQGYKSHVAHEKEDVHLQLFGGTMKFIFIEQHEGRNPRTGEKVTVPDRVAIRFSTAPKNASEFTG